MIQQTITNELQAPDLGKAYTECVLVKLVCWHKTLPHT